MEEEDKYLCALLLYWIVIVLVVYIEWIAIGFIEEVGILSIGCVVDVEVSKYMATNRVMTEQHTTLSTFLRD